MRLLQLAVLYLLIGLVCAVLRLRASGTAFAVDAALLVLFWPLMGPVVWAASPASASATVPADDWLPDPSLALRLESRMAWARSRIAELDGLLSLPVFDLSAAQETLRRLSDGSEAARVSVASSRVQHIERLVRHRADLRRELDRIDELMDQLRVQAAVVRLTGDEHGADSDLEAALLARVECLDELVALSPAG